MNTVADARVPGGANLFTLSVVSHGQGLLVERLLSDLAHLAPPLLAQVIVTRNLPEAPPRAPANLAVPLRFIDNPQPKGFGANHNAAFALCETGWFAVVNPDIRLPQDPFPALLAAGAAAVGLVAPVVLEADGRVADSARALPTPAALLRRHLWRGSDRTVTAADTHGPLPAGSPAPTSSPAPTGSPGPAAQAPHPACASRCTSTPAPAAWYAGMFLALRREACAAVGGFDERYHLYCEDVDLCARLRLAGWQLRQAPAARVVHEAQRASRRSLRHLGWHLRSLARLWTSDAWRRYRALLAAEQAARASGPGTEH